VRGPPYHDHPARLVESWDLAFDDLPGGATGAAHGHTVTIELCCCTPTLKCQQAAAGRQQR
jgi:hypothetical protein